MNLDELTVDDLVGQERKALHDICNQLVVAQGMSSFLKKALSKDEVDLEKQKERIEKLLVSLEKITKIVSDRREVLYALSRDK